MKFVITGASGYLSSHTAANLIAKGVPASDLILVTRDPKNLDDMAKKGATVRAGDFTKPDTLADAFAGGERLFLVTTEPDNFAGFAEQAAAQVNAVNAAKKAGIKRVVLQSSRGVTPEGPPRDLADQAAEKTLTESGMEYAILRTSGFADTRGRTSRRAIRQGGMASNWGEGRSYYICRDDIAAAVTAALLLPGAVRRIYHLVGTGVTAAEIGTILTEIAGKPIPVNKMDDDAYLKSVEANGHGGRIAVMSTQIGRDIREGRASVPPCDLPQLIGRSAIPLGEFFRRNAEELLTGNPPAGREQVFK